MLYLCHPYTIVKAFSITMAFRLTLFIVIATELKPIPSSHTALDPTFSLYDLVIVNGTHGNVGIFWGQNQNLTEVGLFNYINDSDGISSSYHYSELPTKSVRAFSIKKSRLKGEFQRSSGRRVHTDFYESYLDCINQEQIEDCDSLLPSQVFDQLLFAFVAHNFGVDELFYLYNCYKEPHGFNRFYQNYLRLEPRSLVKAVITNAGIRHGDLVKIKELKPQKNVSLQNKAQCFDGSFGEITRFNSGDLTRRNSRNQTEFAVQSLFDKSEKLALRPKYLCGVTKIYVHRITKEVMFSVLVSLRAIWDHKHNEVLYLPSAKDEDGETAFWPRGIKKMKFVNALLVELHSKDPTRILMDVAVSSFFPIVRGYAEDLQRSGILENAVAAMPFYAFIEQKIWYPVIEQMKINSSRAEIEFIEEIDRMINLYTAQIQNTSEEASMRSYLTESVQFNAFCRAWCQKVTRDFERNMDLYAKLFDLLTEQMMQLIGELHPGYSSLFRDPCTLKYSQSHQRMAALQQLSVIRHYLKANANGHDLHVICYGTEENGLLHNSNLSDALAKSINFEWDLNNLNVSEMMANEILSETSVGL